MKIAIVKLSALGDIIHAASVLEPIVAHLPEIKIDWICDPCFADILSHQPHIHAVKTVDIKAAKRSPKAFLNTLMQIRNIAHESHYDLIIDLQGLIKSAIVSRLLGHHVCGFDAKSVRERPASWLYANKFHIPYDLNTIDRYRLLASHALGIDITGEEILEKRPYLGFSDDANAYAEKLLIASKKNVIFTVGANWPSRIYPKEKLREVASTLDTAIFIPHANDAEEHAARFIAQDLSHVHVLPRMNLDQLKAVITKADLLIGNDTGPTYIAWANRIPSITLFGPTPPTRIYATPIHIVLKSPSHVDPYKLNKKDFSIGEIAPQTILDAAHHLLGVS